VAEKEKKETDLDVNAEESTAEVTEENKAEDTDAVDTEQDTDTAEPETAEEAVEEEASGDPRDKKIADLTDRLQRQMAEFENFRRRSDKEKAGMYDMGAADVITKVLDVVDNFERGLAAAGDNSDDPFAQGMEKIYRQLIQTLEQIGVTPIEAVGKEFDPNFHNAVMHCEDDSVGDNIIVQELQKGYMYRDSVVRHSMVKVAN
jgi:molecular chaperone GrpE